MKKSTNGWFNSAESDLLLIKEIILIQITQNENRVNLREIL